MNRTLRLPLLVAAVVLVLVGFAAAPTVAPPPAVASSLSLIVDWDRVGATA